MIPYGRQSISEADVEAVVEVLRGDWLTQGPAVGRFEAAVADYCGVRHAVAVSHGTAALHLACRAAGFGPGDVLWTSPNTFVASANCALYCGGEVDFVDIDPRTFNMSVDALARKLADADVAGRLPAIVMPVHFAGQPCDMAAIAELARRYGFKVIEDASHAIGARFLDSRIGDCRYSDMTIFSFHPVKIITTGEGGMVTTNDERFAGRLRQLREHGFCRSTGCLSDPDAGAWYYEQQELGYNYRMTDFQAALGSSQLQRIDNWVDDRRQLAERYDAALADLPLATAWQDPRGLSAHHLYPVRLNQGAVVRRRLYEQLHARGIRVQVHYIPVHLQPYYHRRGFHPGDFPVAEQYYDGALSLPLFPGLTDDEQGNVIAALNEFL